MTHHKNSRGFQIGKKPVHFACHRGYADIVEILLSKNCSLESHVDVIFYIAVTLILFYEFYKDLFNPMVLACQKDHDNVVEMLWFSSSNLRKCDVRVSGPL